MNGISSIIKIKYLLYIVWDTDTTNNRLFSGSTTTFLDKIISILKTWPKGIPQFFPKAAVWVLVYYNSKIYKTLTISSYTYFDKAYK